MSTAAEWIFLSIICFIIVALLWMFSYGVYDDSKSEKITLIKKNWNCTEKKTSLQPTIVGKVSMLSPITKCVKYERK